MGMRRTALNPWQINYLFVILLLFKSGEGDETTPPSFATANVLIEASSTSLEALIASLLPSGDIAK